MPTPTALANLGSTSAHEQGKKWTFQRGGAEAQLWTYKGPSAAVASLYNSFKSSALIDPRITVIDFDEGRGLGTLTVTYADEQAVLGVSNENGIVKFYEMIPNEFSKRPELSPYFTQSATPITNDEIRAAYNAHNDSSYQDEATAVTKYGLSGLSLILFRILESGTEEYLETAYVLRETKVVSGKNAVQANFTNVNRVETPPVASAGNVLIGSISSLGGEWLKKAPSIRQITRAKWTVQTEWWWASGWDYYLYGGSLNAP